MAGDAVPIALSHSSICKQLQSILCIGYCNKTPSSKAELIMAIYDLGVSFQQGWGVVRNKQVAFYYFELAANLGDLDAMNDLAFCYLHGHGVRKGVFRAAKYYRMAAKQGQGLVGNSWIWKQKYDVVETPGWSE